MEDLQAEYVTAINHLSSASVTMEDLQAEYVLHAGLQSDADEGVPKSQPPIRIWTMPIGTSNSISREMENFLQREAWKLMPRNLLPKGRRTLKTRWIFKLKSDGTRKSRNVVKGYEQIPGADFTESFAPLLATNTTICIALCVALEQGEEHDDWVTIMVDVEAAFLNALIDQDIYIEMPAELREHLEAKGQEVGACIIKLQWAQYGLI